MAIPKIRDTFQKPPSGWKVTDPKTGIRFDSNSYRNLREKIRTHRRSNNMETDDIDSFIADQICDKNEPFFCQEWVISARSPIQKMGLAELWGELHERALAHECEQDWVWFNAWQERIPSLGCSCKNKWKDLVKQFPPDWNNYFKWSVSIHSKVSESIGKMPMTEYQARQIWDKH